MYCCCHLNSVCRATVGAGAAGICLSTATGRTLTFAVGMFDMGSSVCCAGVASVVRRWYFDASGLRWNITQGTRTVGSFIIRLALKIPRSCWQQGRASERLNTSPHVKVKTNPVTKKRHNAVSVSHYPTMDGGLSTVITLYNVSFSVQMQHCSSSLHSDENFILFFLAIHA